MNLPKPKSTNCVHDLIITGMQQCYDTMTEER